MVKEQFLILFVCFISVPAKGEDDGGEGLCAAPARSEKTKY